MAARDGALGMALGVMLVGCAKQPPQPSGEPTSAAEPQADGAEAIPPLPGEYGPASESLAVHRTRGPFESLESYCGWLDRRPLARPDYLIVGHDPEIYGARCAAPGSAHSSVIAAFEKKQEKGRDPFLAARIVVTEWDEYVFCAPAMRTERGWFVGAGFLCHQEMVGDDRDGAVIDELEIGALTAAEGQVSLSYTRKTETTETQGPCETEEDDCSGGFGSLRATKRVLCGAPDGIVVCSEPVTLALEDSWKADYPSRPSRSTTYTKSVDFYRQTMVMTPEDGKATDKPTVYKVDLGSPRSLPAPSPGRFARGCAVTTGEYQTDGEARGAHSLYSKAGLPEQIQRPRQPEPMWRDATGAPWTLLVAASTDTEVCKTMADFVSRKQPARVETIWISTKRPATRAIVVPRPRAVVRAGSEERGPPEINSVQLRTCADPTYPCSTTLGMAAFIGDRAVVAFPAGDASTRYQLAITPFSDPGESCDRQTRFTVSSPVTRVGPFEHRCGLDPATEGH